MRGNRAQRAHVGLALTALLLAPWWSGGMLTNITFLAARAGQVPTVRALWQVAALWPGGGVEPARLASVALLKAGQLADADQAARQAVSSSGREFDPGTPLPLLQRGLVEARLDQPDAALLSWRFAGAGPYFCTQATQALYQRAPPDPLAAATAATTCTTLNPQAGPGWLVLAQARAQLGDTPAALAAFDSAYTTLLAAGNRNSAAVAAATAARLATPGGPASALWHDRAAALAPTVCSDPARPHDAALDALCAEPR